MEETKAHLVTVATFLLSAVLGAKQQASIASEKTNIVNKIGTVLCITTTVLIQLLRMGSIFETNLLSK